MANEKEGYVRVFRIIEYYGPKEAVDVQVARSIQGSIQPGPVRITAATLAESPESILARFPEVEPIFSRSFKEMEVSDGE